MPNTNNKITISGHHVELTEGMTNHVHDKLSPLFAHHNITDIKVILDIEKEGHRAEATLHIPGQKALHAEASTGDMYGSIDELATKLITQLKKEHDKHSHHHQEALKKAAD